LLADDRESFSSSNFKFTNAPDCAHAVAQPGYRNIDRCAFVQSAATNVARSRRRNLYGERGEATGR
jgi:hypothetical protein